MKSTSFLFLFFLTVTNASAQDVRSQLRQVANDLAKQIEAKGKKRIVIASFLDLDNKETQLGRYMADKFSIGLSTASSLEITDRSQLAQLLRDNKLAAERILDPRTIPSLGRITGAEVIIIGNYTALDNSVDITVKAIELERGLRLAVAEGTIPRTSEINKLLSEVDYSSNESDNLVTNSSSINRFNSLEGNWVYYANEGGGCEDMVGSLIQIKGDKAIIISVPEKMYQVVKGDIAYDNITMRDQTNYLSEKGKILYNNGSIGYAKAIFKLINGGKELMVVWPGREVCCPNQRWKRIVK